MLDLEKILQAVAGLVLFLYGMQHIGGSLKFIAGGSFRNFLAKVTGRPILGLMSGALVTVGLQSSGATTLFLAGLADAGLIELRQAVIVILGADIGTTITVQLISFNLFAYSPIGLVGGWLWTVLGRTERSRAIGRMVLGGGMLFFGMGIMAATLGPLGKIPEVQSALAEFAQRPWLGIIAAAVFTAIVRSSATTIVLALGLSQAGVITLNEAIPIILGANVGTCSTALIATIGLGRAAWRIASAHIFFKITGVLLIYPFIPYFAVAATSFSDWCGADAGRQVANAHTLFNVFVAFFFLPWAGLVAKSLDKWLPDKSDVDKLLKYIHPGADVPAEHALRESRLEVMQLTHRVANQIKLARKAIIKGDEKSAEGISRETVKIREIEKALNDYTSDIRRKSLDHHERETCSQLQFALRSLYHANSIVSDSLMHLRRELLQTTPSLPVEGIVSMDQYFELVEGAMASFEESLKGVEPNANQTVLTLRLSEAMRLHEQRLKRDVPGASSTSFVFSEIMLQLFTLAREMESAGRIFSHSPQTWV